MYLVDFQLKYLCENHALVHPYVESNVNPASVDLILGEEFVNISDKQLVYRRASCPEPLIAQPGDRFWAHSVTLHPGVAVLAATVERIRIPDYSVSVPTDTSHGFVHDVPACVGELRLKSSAARRGFDHTLAGWIDPGFRGNLTLELHAHRPVDLEAGKSYVQLIVAATVATPGRSYQETGRYVGNAAVGPVEAK